MLHGHGCREEGSWGSLHLVQVKITYKLFSSQTLMLYLPFHSTKKVCYSTPFAVFLYT